MGQNNHIIIHKIYDLKSLTFYQYFCKKILTNLQIKTQVIGQNDRYHKQIFNCRVFFRITFSTSSLNKIIRGKREGVQNNYIIIYKLCDTK